MHNIKWYRLLALGMLAVPVASPAQGPQPKISELVAIPGVEFNEATRMPNRHVVIYDSAGSIMAYDLTTKRSTLITRTPANLVSWDLNVSAQGDRLTYSVETKDTEIDDVIWAIAIDPVTGAPAAPAQRVTLSKGGGPVFSPDGKSIAFIKDKTDSSNKTETHEVAVIPATGGTERVLAKFDKVFYKLAWSADGKWIYIQDMGTFARDKNADPNRSIWRVPVTGGPRELVTTYAQPKKAKSEIDARFAFFDVAWGTSKIGYLTANGNRGEYDVLPGSQWGWTFAPRETITKTTRPMTLHVLELASGKVRDVPVVGENARYPVVSPDDKHLAIVTGTGDHGERVVMNIDGSGARRFPVKNGDLAGVPSWSPDGSSLMFLADSGHKRMLLDIATGNSRVVASEEKPRRLGVPFWQPGGKSFLATTIRAGKAFAVVEFGLDGTRRVIRDLSTEFPTMTGISLFSNNQAVLELRDSSTNPKLRFVLVQLTTGVARPLPMSAVDAGTIRYAAPSSVLGAHSDKWYVATLSNAADKLVGIEVMSTGTEPTRIVRVPDMGDMWGNTVSPLLISDTHLVAFGQAPGDHDVTAYSVPIDGTAPRVLARIPDPRATGAASSFALSPDRTVFAFFSAGLPTTHIYDVDLAPIYQLINKKP